MVFGARVRLLGRDIEPAPAPPLLRPRRRDADLQNARARDLRHPVRREAVPVSDAMRESSRAVSVALDLRRRDHRPLRPAPGRDAAARSIYELPLTVWHDVQGSKLRSADFVRSRAPRSPRVENTKSIQSTTERPSNSTDSLYLRPPVLTGSEISRRSPARSASLCEIRHRPGRSATSPSATSPRRSSASRRLLEATIADALAAGETNYPPSDGVDGAAPARSSQFYDERARPRLPDRVDPHRRRLAADHLRGLRARVVDPGDKVVYPIPSWNNNHYTLPDGRRRGGDRRRSGDELPADRRAAAAAHQRRAPHRASARRSIRPAR